MDEQIRELTLLLLYLTSWTEKEYGDETQRAWKGYDFGVLDSLRDEKLIGGNSYKSKSTYLTESGINKAKELIRKYNINEE